MPPSTPCTLQVTHSRPSMPQPPMPYTLHTYRSRIEQDFKGLLSDKDAASARLHAEITRLRSALTQAQALQASHASEVLQMQEQVQQAASVNRCREGS